jgi:hypothetical protein
MTFLYPLSQQNDTVHAIRYTFKTVVIPRVLALYRVFIIASFSMTGKALKCFRTATASCSFDTRCLLLARAMLGDSMPIPELRTACARGDE